MPPVLPKTVVAATRFNPKILLLYSLPKVGKTSNLAKLPECLTIDLESGADMYDMLRLTANSTKDIRDIKDAIIADGIANKGKYPYKYIALDPIDKLEEFCEVSATAKYKKSVIGKNFEGASVLELPKGLGWYYIRNEVIEIIDVMASVCPHLILTAHVKDKILESKGGVETTTRDISLSGKLSGMVSAKADAIGYMYRDKGKLMVSFETTDGPVMGGRFDHLNGPAFEFDWNKIFLPRPAEALKAA